MLWVSLAILALTFAAWKCLNTFFYWHSLGVRQPGFLTILKDFWFMVAPSKSIADWVLDDYRQFPDERYFGTYQFLRPVVMVRDPELYKRIAVKDFDHFVDHQVFVSEVADPFWAKNLFALNGEKWREMRSILSPSFTGSKMRAMFALISECGAKFVNHFATSAMDTINIEMKDAFTKYTNDVISSAAFGAGCDSLAEPRNEFYLMGKEALDFSGFWTNLKFMVMTMSPSLSGLLGFSFFPKKVARFFIGLVRETIRVREKEGITRPDMIHLLMEARKGRLRHDEDEDTQKEAGFAVVEESQVGRTEGALKKHEFTDVDITAQAMIFFLAGFGTVSSAMCFMAYELAVNPEIQEKLYDEIEDHLEANGGKLTYETLLKMKYLDMVLSETLRKWPPSIASDRLCVKPYTIEPERPGEKAVQVEKGMVISIPTYGIHRDEKYYQDPEKFDPERFSEENRKTLNPYAYLPFGHGPRACIGSRFALLETKAVFAHLLAEFEIVAIEKTPVPMVLTKKDFTLDAEGGFWLGLKPRRR